MSTYRLWKFLHALEHRAFLLFEANRLKKLGVEFPPGLLRDIWKRPHEVEDFVHIKAFCYGATPRQICLVDVGANIGEFADDFLTYFRGARCIAFEPDPRNAAVLREKFANIANFTIFGYALSDTDGTAEFSLSENTKYSSLESYNNIELQFRNDVEIKKINAPLARFDKIDLELEDTFNILKIDVQGHELETVKGFGQSLSKFGVCLIETAFAEEYVDKTPSFAEIVGVMKQNNLFPIVFQRFGRAHNSYGYERDVLFVHRDLLKRAYWPSNNPS